MGAEKLLPRLKQPECEAKQSPASISEDSMIAPIFLRYVYKDDLTLYASVRCIIPIRNKNIRNFVTAPTYAVTDNNTA